MKTFVLVLLVAGFGAASGAVASDNESMILNTTGSRVRIPLEKFRTRSSHERILTRKDQLVRRHVGGVGMSVKPIMSPVRDQGLRGTCSAFAAIALIEAFTGGDLSEQCLARFSSPRDPGRVEQRLAWVRDNGVYQERDCRYDLTQRDNIPDLRYARVTEFDSELEVYPFTEDDPLAYIKSRLAVSSPVAVEFFVVGHDQWRSGPFLYTPDAVTVARECGFEQSCGGHAVVVTGVNDDLQLIEFKNSWGRPWGKDGYGYMSYDYFLTFGKGVLASY